MSSPERRSLIAYREPPALLRGGFKRALTLGLSGRSIPSGPEALQSPPYYYCAWSGLLRRTRRAARGPRHAAPPRTRETRRDVRLRPERLRAAWAWRTHDRTRSHDPISLPPSPARVPHAATGAPRRAPRRSGHHSGRCSDKSRQCAPVPRRCRAPLRPAPQATVSRTGASAVSYFSRIE